LRDDQGGNSKLVYESENKRYRNTEVLDKVIEYDKLWRKSN